MTKLQEIRLKKGLSQFELAKFANISIQSIQKYEQGKYCFDNCHFKTIVRISEILNTSFVELLESDDLRRRVVLQLQAPPVQHAER